MQEKASLQHFLKVDRIVPTGFVTVLVFLGITTAISEISKVNLIKTQQEIANTFKVKELLTELEKTLVEAETRQLGFLITGKEEYLEAYTSGQRNFKTQSDSLKELIRYDSSQIQRAEKIIQMAQAKFAALEEPIALKKAGKAQEISTVVDADNSQQIMGNIKAQLAQMNQQQQRLLAQTQVASAKFQQLSTIIGWGGWLVSVGAGIYISFYIARQIMQPINEAVKAIANSSANIATTVSQQENTMLQQSISVNQTTTTVEQIGTSALQSAKQAETSTTEVKQALTLVEEGTITVHLTIEGISDLRDQVMAIANQTARLSEQAAQISTVSQLAGELASKTNILALNAEVEAARVEAQGKGFAVVAKEIRQLADQSRKSAELIKDSIYKVQEAINATVTVTDEGTKKATEGIKLAQETGDAFMNIAEAINKVFLKNQQIALTAKQQSIAVQQIVSAMNMINLGAKETADGITQMKEATLELNEAAQNLKNLV